MNFTTFQIIQCLCKMYVFQSRECKWENAAVVKVSAIATRSFACAGLHTATALDDALVGGGMKGDVSVQWFVKKLHGLYFEKIKNRRNDRGGTVIVK